MKNENLHNNRNRDQDFGQLEESKRNDRNTDINLVVSSNPFMHAQLQDEV